MINRPEKALPNRYNQLHPSLQFLLFACLFVLVMVAGIIIGVFIALCLYGLDPIKAMQRGDFTALHVSSTLWIIQVAGMTIPLLVSAVIYGYSLVKEPLAYLKSTFRFPWVLIVLVFCIMFISSPIIEILGNVNSKMVLPHFLDSLQQWMREKEDAAQKMTALLLNMKTVGDMVVNVLIIGLLTAIAEEFMFRGVIQTIFMRWTKNIHAAVWITAILFSAFHMEFFGFLPRLFLGALFGYFVAWSGSIWPAVWAHFINNGTAVVVTYLYQRKKINMNPDDQHLFNSAGYIISMVIVLFLMYIYRTINTPKTNVAARLMEKNWIKIFTSRDFYRSEIVKQVLIEHQIHSVLINKQDSSHRAFGDVEVYIHQENFSNAIEIMILNQI